MHYNQVYNTAFISAAFMRDYKSILFLLYGCVGAEDIDTARLE